MIDRAQVDACSFVSWYPSFADLTAESVVIPLSAEFIEYLNADGIVLPVQEKTVYSNELNGYSDDESEQNDWAEDSCDDAVAAPKFDELCVEVEDAIRRLGGVAFPKLNWSAPKDAGWISKDGTLKCTCFNDVCLLLKSSDFVAHDLKFAYSNTDVSQQDQAQQIDSSTTPGVTIDTAPSSSTASTPTEEAADLKSTNSAAASSNSQSQRNHPADTDFALVLRRWQDVQPSTEFRCFVKDNTVVGISQRHHSAHFKFLKNEKENILSRINAFFNENINGRFPNHLGASRRHYLMTSGSDDYTFDVYSLSKDLRRLQLMDFNPFCENTDALLFTWEYLHGLKIHKMDRTADTIVRVVEDSDGIQPSPYLSYRLPKDTIDLASGEDVNKMIDFFRVKELIRKPGGDSDSDSTCSE